MEVMMSLPDIELELDWEAYYEDFKRIHGLDPVNSKDGHYLVFPDGWRYSSHRPSGPEYPPSDDRERLLYSSDYWEVRRGVVKHELRFQEQRLRSLTNLQERLSARLFTHTVIEDEYSEGYQTHISPLDIDMLQGRITWLKQDLIECDTKLEEIQTEISAKGIRV